MKMSLILSQKKVVLKNNRRTSVLLNQFSPGVTSIVINSVSLTAGWVEKLYSPQDAHFQTSQLI